MKYIRVKWKQPDKRYRTTLYSEVDDDRWELRKIELFADGRVGFADRLGSSSGTRLSIEPLPPLSAIAGDPEFDPCEITTMNMRNDENFSRLQQAVESDLQTAEMWEKKRDFVWTVRNFESAARLTLAIAVGKYPDAKSAKQYLARQSIITLLRKLSGLQQSLLAEVEAGRVSADEFSGNYISLVLSHLCCVLNEFPLAREYAVRAFHPKILSTSTNFWYDYARGYRCVWEKQPYQKGTFPSLRHSESYWLPYMDLMEAASTGASLDRPLTAIDESLKNRNEDKRVNDDSYMLDGSPYHAVQWNFRRDGLLSLIQHLRG